MDPSEGGTTKKHQKVVSLGDGFLLGDEFSYPSSVFLWGL